MQAVNLNIKGIQCDNKQCDYKDETVEFKDYGAWLNKPCPKCGANLFTEDDLNSLTMLVNVANILNQVVPEVPDNTPKATMAVEMNGTGEIGFKIMP